MVGPFRIALLWRPKANSHAQLARGGATDRPHDTLPRMNAANTALAVTGAIASVIAVLIVLYPPFRRFALTRLAHLFGVRYGTGWSKDTVNRAISNATERIWILQTWIPTLNEDISYWQDHVRDGVSFRILLANHTLIAARIKYRPRCFTMERHNVEVIKTFNENHNSVEIKVRHYSGLPFGPVYIVDDTVYWGIYLAHTDSMRGPQFVCSRESLIGNMIEESFNAMWDIEGQTPRPEDTASGGTLAESSKQTQSAYQRYCSQCGTWLEYRNFGPPAAMATESYCPNPECSKFKVKVEDVHVS
jgi:hypothetical protein